ncbi:MAG: adenylosuccinate synthetase [Nitrososphaeraceae archaeon]
MKTKATAVIGSGWGDEGKGLITDYFSSVSDEKTIVVRYNGGCQAGHSVELKDGTRHVFSHFSSGTFCNKPTVLSDHFVVNPVLFIKEYDELKKLGYTPKVYVHPACKVTTLYDMYVNQHLEIQRGKNPHGSVGVGFGETVNRHDHFPLTVYDLLNESLLEDKLNCIREEWSNKQICEPITHKDVGTIMNLTFLQNCRLFMECIELFDWEQFQSNNSNIIFEGAQGLMLDQDYGYFPHVTRSNTGLKNIVDILKNFEIEQLDVTHVSRVYSTRHGAGPFPYETTFPAHIIDKTNKPNKFQGRLRYAPLNWTQLMDAINWDYNSIPTDLPYNINKSIAFTCVDQLIDDNCIIMNGQRIRFAKNKFEEFLKSFSNIKYLSYGPTRNTITEII